MMCPPQATLRCTQHFCFQILHNNAGSSLHSIEECVGKRLQRSSELHHEKSVCVFVHASVNLTSHILLPLAIILSPLKLSKSTENRGREKGLYSVLSLNSSMLNLFIFPLISH